jgi:hypothetical protein
VTTGVALTDARRLTTQAAQVVKLRSSHSASLHYVNMVNDRRVKRKNPLDADTEAGLSHSDCFSGPAMFASDDDTFKSL